MKDLPLPSLERWPRLHRLKRRAGYAFSQLLGGRWGLFVGLDTLFVVTGYVDSAMHGARLEHVFRQSVLMPSILLAIPALAGTVALERRAGSLDLALSVPSTERYFLRRTLPVLALLAAQGAFLLTLCWLENLASAGTVSARTRLTADLARALAQTVTLLAFLGATALFWAVRLRGAGAVAVSTALTTLLFWTWLGVSPRIASAVGQSDRLFGLPTPAVTWTASLLVIAAATAIFYLYARERLRRPETMLR